MFNININVLLCATVLLSIFSCIFAAGCEINPTGVKLPLLVNPSDTSVIYPQHGQKTVKFRAGEIVELACPGQKVMVDGLEFQSSVHAACISNEQFVISGKNYLWKQIRCSANPKSIGRMLNSNCGTNGRLAEIGFDLGNNRFIKSITICFDTKNQITLYSYLEMTASIASKDPSTARPNFAQDNGFYDVGSKKVNQLYTTAQQRITINALIGLAANSTKYIQNGNSFFIARGHLIAKTDLVYAAEQNATFRFINAAPQWQTFNAGNWLKAETNTRSYANEKNVNLQVWTGTYGVTSLPHVSNGHEVPLYLYVNGNTHGIPVPAIFWKIVYNPINKEGIILIGVNNPYETKTSKYVICPDVSNEVHWLTWNKHDIVTGFSYACTIASFRKVVTYAPNLVVSGLLK